MGKKYNYYSFNQRNSCTGGVGTEEGFAFTGIEGLGAVAPKNLGGTCPLCPPPEYAHANASFKRMSKWTELLIHSAVEVLQKK